MGGKWWSARTLNSWSICGLIEIYIFFTRKGLSSKSKENYAPFLILYIADFECCCISFTFYKYKFSTNTTFQNQIGKNVVLQSCPPRLHNLKFSVLNGNGKL